MIDIKQNRYYKRLTTINLWVGAGFIGMIVLFVTTQVLVFYFKYVPELLAPIRQSVSPDTIEVLASGIGKIIINLSGWIIALIIVNVSLLYIAWNVKKLLADLNS